MSQPPASLRSMFARLAAASGGQHRERFATLAQQIAEGDEGVKYAQLTELVDALNMATEDILNGMRAELLVPPTVACLRLEHNVDLMYLAARVLTYMADSVPPTAAVIIRSGGLPLLCEKLMMITDIELAEQCIACLDRIAGEHPAAVLEAGGPMALLSFVDFFNIAVQRSAVVAVSKLCTQVRPNRFSYVSAILPQLRQFVMHDDEKLAEAALLSLSRIAAGVKSDSSSCSEVFGDTAPLVLEVIENRKPGARLSAATRFLVNVAACPLVAEMLAELGACKTIAEVLSSASGAADLNVSSGTPTNDNIAVSPSSGTPIAGTPLRTPTHLAASPANSASNVLPSTPPTRPAGGSLPPDVVSDLCAVLKQMLPRAQSDFLLYIDEGLNLVYSHATRAPASAGEAGEDDDDEDDDDDDDDEDEDADGDQDDAQQGGEDEDDGGEDEDDGQHQGISRRERARLSSQQARAERELLHTLLRAQGVVVETNEKWRRCVSGHSCDSCGKHNLRLGDWFRSNDQQDYDLCQQCLCLSSTGRSSPSGSASDETFTDMAALHATGAPAAAQSAAAAARTPQPDDRQEMLERSPYLLDRIADGLVVAVHLALESDAPNVRSNCIEFVTRYAAQTKTKAHATSLLTVPSIGAFLSLLLRKAPSRLSEAACGVFIVSRLIELDAETAQELFAREGVLHALSSLRSIATGTTSRPASPVLSGAGRTFSAASLVDPTEDTIPLHVQTSNLLGWRALLGKRAARLMQSLAGASDRPPVVALNAAVDALERDSWCEAVDNLVVAVETGASAFEVLHSGIVEILVKHLQASGLDPEAPQKQITRAVLLVGRLIEVDPDVPNDASPGPAGTLPSATPMVKLLRHLHGLIGQLETFPSGSSTVSHRPIRLVITAHGASAPSSPASPGSPGELNRRSSRELGGRRPQRATVNVSIEPLATIAAVADFISARMLGQSPNPGRASNTGEQAGGNEDDDDVEEVLPHLKNAAATPSRAAPRSTGSQGSGGAQPGSPTTSSGPRVFIRYGRHTLPHSLSMQQVVQQYVPRASRDEPIPLFFSTEPFAQPAGAESTTAAGRPYSYEPTYAGATVLHRCAIDVKDAVEGRFAVEECTGCDVGGPLVSIFRLMKVLQGIARNPRSVFDWFDSIGRQAVGSSPDVPATVAQTSRTDAERLQTAVRLLASYSQATESIGLDLVNTKLVNKALRCVDGPSCIPLLIESWCVALASDLPALFTLACRRLLVEVAFFGTTRALVRVVEHCRELEIPIGAAHRSHRVSRKKFRVWRDQPLECAKEVFSAYGTSRAMFDFQYYNEVGSGLGPTHEFFNLVGMALQQQQSTPTPSTHGEAGTRLWRSTEASADVGLYPECDATELASADGAAEERSGIPREERRDAANFVGLFLPRAMLDHHVIGVRLAPTLVRVLRGDQLVLDDVRDVSPAVWHTLHALVRANALNAPTITLANGSSVPIPDLGLVFTVPGVADEIELLAGGAERPVSTGSEALEYATLAGDAILRAGSRTTLANMRESFNRLLALRSLKLFDVEELDALLCGHQEPVSAAEWAAHTSCDHGFTSSSPTIRFLYEALGEMDAGEQAQFIRFLTGAPQLPVGGLPALRPRITIVRKKISEGGLAAEVAQLPSAMTCQNYLKLPAYETKEMLVAKLRQAVQEGAASFSFT